MPKLQHLRQLLENARRKQEAHREGYDAVLGQASRAEGQRVDAAQRLSAARHKAAWSILDPIAEAEFREARERYDRAVSDARQAHANVQEFLQALIDAQERVAACESEYEAALANKDRRHEDQEQHRQRQRRQEAEEEARAWREQQRAKQEQERKRQQQEQHRHQQQRHASRHDHPLQANESLKQKKRITEADAIAFRAEMSLLGDYATLTAFPAPPSEPCGMLACTRSKADRLLEACPCNIRRVFAGERNIKVMRTGFHPDKFARCPKILREDFQNKAQEVFVVLSAMLEDEQRVRRGSK
jgi:hypothetical protein